MNSNTSDTSAPSQTATGKWQSRHSYRLGNLLVRQGALTPEQLVMALRKQREKGQNKPLGTILTEEGYVSPAIVRVTLGRQMVMRAMVACCAFILGFSSLIPHTALATSAVSPQTPAREKSQPEAQVEPAAFSRETRIEEKRDGLRLFESDEIKSADISPFTKWVSVKSRLNPSFSQLPAELQALKNESFDDKVAGVNRFYNKKRYIEDNQNWGTSDYWATPAEFQSRGGDCEDFAIAKYAALRALGVPDAQMRVAIVQDTWKGIPHAVLVVYAEDDVKLLDNQYREVRSTRGFDRYRPIYSINRQFWWRHIQS